MPRWDLQCEECGLVVEVEAKNVEEAEHMNTPCPDPDCLNSAPLVRKFSAPNFTIKGFSARNGYSGGGENG